MDQELERVYSLMQEARDPEDLFGVDPVVLPQHGSGSQWEKREREYRTLKAVTAAPYSSPEDRGIAHDLDQRLEEFYRRAKARIEANLYNLPGRRQTIPVSSRSQFFEIGERRYYVGSRFRSGEATTLYNGYLESNGVVLGAVLLKVALRPELSPFIERQANLLAVLRREEYRETGYLPVVLDRFEAGGRQGLVLRRLDGFNLEEIRQYGPHRDGVDPRDMVWSLSRVLAVLGLAHTQGIVHGRICPRHIVLDTVQHHVMVAGWGGAALNPAVSGQRILAPTETFSAPETSGPAIGPWSDIYSIGKTFLWFLGGDPVTGEIPHTVAPELAAFLRSMAEPDVYRRPDDCWQLYQTLDGLKARLWGPPKWRPFAMPEPTLQG